MSRPNMALSPTPPPAIYEHLFVYMAVAFYRGAFGGAAKRNRWAASQPVKLSSDKKPCREKVGRKELLKSKV